MRKCQTSKVENRPVVVRIVDFFENDFRDNLSVTCVSENTVSDAAWEMFEENSLVISNGSSVGQYAEEFPIVKYKCSDTAEMFPSCRLNAFIESITVSTVDYGRRFYLDKRNMSFENENQLTIAYYTDNIGRNYEIIQYDVSRFLMKKPKLVVSPEGVLVFYNDKYILATVDCNNYAWVDLKIPDAEICEIESLDDYCKITIYNPDGKVADKESFKLQFSINMLAHIMIKPVLKKLQ